MNSENLYWKKAVWFKREITKYLETILKVYGYELLLRIEELNLLNDLDNSTESSTAIGYCLEEFIVSKLITFTKNHNEPNQIKIQRNGKSTQNSSYDFFSIINNSLFMVNVKANKKNNNGVAAINKLVNDYVYSFPGHLIYFFVIKFNYEISSNRKIKIKSLDSYFLEEIDLSKGHHQDSRNWSKELNLNSGRLQISNSFRTNNMLEKNKISFERTKKFLLDIFESNKKTNN